MNINVRKLVLGGLLLAIGIILPMLFHMVGINGVIFSPMHIPVLLGGFILGPFLGAIVGIITPVLSFLFSGMPPMPILWIMMVELGLYGLLSGVLYKVFKKNVILTLVSSMILGRLGGGLTAFVLSNLFNLKLNATMFLRGAFVTAWPGIILHMLLIPLLVKAYSLSLKKQY